MSQRIISTIPQNAPQPMAATNLPTPHIGQKIPLIQFGLVQHPAPEPHSVAGQIIEIAHIVSYEKVLEAIQWAINYIVDDRTFISAPVCRIMEEIALVKFWTNVDCSELDDIEIEAKDIYGVYDALLSFGIIGAAKSKVQLVQQEFFFTTLRETCQAIIDYRNSAAGILEQVRQDSAEDKDQLTSALQSLDTQDDFGVAKKILEFMQQEGPAVG